MKKERHHPSTHSEQPSDSSTSVELSFPASEIKENFENACLSVPTSSKKQELRRRVGKKVRPKENGSHLRTSSPIPNPNTPKRTETTKLRTTSGKKVRNIVCKTATPKKASAVDTATNSPFGYYISNSNVHSPLNNNTSNEIDERSIGDLLSLNDYDSVQNSKQNRPSMSRSRFERESIEQEKAAQERIQKRISSIGERRRKKTGRYML